MNKDKDFVLSLFMIFLFGSIYLSLGSVFMDVNLYSLPGMLSAVYIGAFEMGIPFVFFGLALRKSTNTALVNQLCYLSPFISLFIISLVLGEKILPTTFAGLFLIVFGIIFNEYLVKKRNSAS
jgi:drug/metabolite transporter (DMT)-like permease